jgi:FKBP-type peptidyl-prolyl cis-trans isomerase FkpA
MSVTAVPIQPLRQGSVLKLWLGLALLAFAAAAAAWYGTSAFRPITTETGVKLRVVKEGTGARITEKDVAALRYKLHVGSVEAPVIQDSDQTGQPFVTTTDGVYPGFGEGMKMMRQGGRYILWVPPGQHVQGPVPPGTPFQATDTLVFEIEVMQLAAGMADQFRMQQQEQMRRQLEQLQPPPGAEGGDEGRSKGR